MAMAMALRGDELRLDGNAAAGVLAEIYGVEMTVATGTCDGCGTTGPLGRALVYAHGMGMIVRCPLCDTPLIRIARIRGAYRLDLRGLRVLHLAPRT